MPQSENSQNMFPPLTPHFCRPRPGYLVEVRGSPLTGYFVPACVWAGSQADFGHCSRFGVRAFGGIPLFCIVLLMFWWIARLA